MRSLCACVHDQGLLGGHSASARGGQRDSPPVRFVHRVPYPRLSLCVILPSPCSMHSPSTMGVTALTALTQFHILLTQRASVLSCVAVLESMLTVLRQRAHTIDPVAAFEVDALRMVRVPLTDWDWGGPIARCTSHCGMFVQMCATQCLASGKAQTTIGVGELKCLTAAVPTADAVPPARILSCVITAASAFLAATAEMSTRLRPTALAQVVGRVTTVTMCPSPLL